nr:calpain-13 isoform X1 [Manis javanica]XP_036865188.1 calpain-13 isoform X1 [Manis javanica]XP_036865189.1 calpain-13 isoform X1 [Manis javanica]
MAYNQDPPAETPIIKFKGQDFSFLRDYCLGRGLLFEDETFPAETSSIGLGLLKGHNLSRLMWKRPQDILEGRSEPHFILEGVSRFDIRQGKAADCWFLAALGSLTQSPQHLQKILIDQSFSHQYAGIFRFRFWRCGQWVEVVVDDRLPVLNKEYLFVYPRSNQEFWPCLLEKAYAKFHGSYLNLHYGYLPDALVDLTGGVVTSVNLHSSSSDLVMVVKMAAKAGSLMTCATPPGNTDSSVCFSPLKPTEEATVLENGLVNKHAYTVTDAEQIQYRRRWEDLIRLWNPWGKTEWRGRWRDGSLEWQETHSQRKGQLHENKDDGEFWMSCRDFQENFSSLFICNQFPVSMDRGSMPPERWSQMIFKDHAIPGHQRDMQYFFCVPENMESNNVIVSFNIMPQNVRTKNKEFPLIFSVFKVDPQFQHFRERLPSTFFHQFRNPDKGITSQSNYNLTKYFNLTQGTYVVVVSAHKAVEFLLRIFLKMPESDRNLGSNFNLRALKGLNIDASQLQTLLNQELLTGSPGDTFSLDECRSIVALMELKVNGRLDQEEFSRLWSRLVCCQSVFQNIQKHSGVFLSSDLWKAIKDADFLAGISVNKELLDLMTLRYSDHTGRVGFSSLVCFLLRLEAMARTFQNLSKDGKGLYLTKMEWMNLVMYN